MRMYEEQGVCSAHPPTIHQLNTRGNGGGSAVIHLTSVRHLQLEVRGCAATIAIAIYLTVYYI